jgi:capsid protein
MMRWEPERLGYGKASYCTAVQMIDPDRLSNHMNMFDTADMRGGVQIDRFGAAVAIISARPTRAIGTTPPKASPGRMCRARRITGRPIIIHDFDKDRAGQHRGVGCSARAQAPQNAGEV